MIDASDRQQIERVVKAGGGIRQGMRDLLTYCNERILSDLWSRLADLDYEADVPLLRHWLVGVLSTEPPSDDIDGFWFGLFNPVNEQGESCDVYVSGAGHFDPADDTGDWAVDPAYFPEDRYAGSKVLDRIYRTVMSAEPEVADFGDYTLCLGYACLLVGELCRSIDPKVLLGGAEARGVAVGFDSGDFVLLGTVDEQGFRSDAQLQ